MTQKDLFTKKTIRFKKILDLIDPVRIVILLLGISSLGLLIAWSLSQAFHLELLGSLEELGELVLGHVHLPGVHELEDGREVVEGDIFQDDDWVFGWVLL